METPRHPFDELWERTLDPIVGNLPAEQALYAVLREVFAQIPPSIETALTDYQVDIAERSYRLGFDHGQRFRESLSED